jgi:adenylyltransferase/sulfurtransferase
MDDDIRKEENDIFNERYLRQLRIPGWDQKKIKGSSALIAGIGGLGSVSATYLAVAGVGRLVICDPGIIERSNLNRQVLYTEVSIGASKVEVARARLRAANPEVEIEIYNDLIKDDNIERIAEGCDIIVDGLDNQEGRFLLNDFTVKKKLPFVYGAVCGWEGIVGVFQQPGTGCLACLISPRRSFINSHSGSVVGTTPALIGAMQSAETLKIMMEIESCLMGKLLIVDTKCMKFDIINLEKNTECPVCSNQ